MAYSRQNAEDLYNQNYGQDDVSNFQPGTYDPRLNRIPKLDEQSVGINQPSYLNAPTYTAPTRTNAAGVTETGKDTKEGGGAGDAAVGVGKQVIAGVTNMAKQNDAASAAQYSNDYGTWQGQEPYYFNPNADTKPDLEGYMKRYPSKLDALSNSSNSKLFKNYTNTGVDVVADISHAALGKKGDYIYQQSFTDASSGFASGGWVGAVVGGVLGIVKGIFSWDDAETQDAKARANALADYNNALKEWNLKRQAMMDAQNVASAQEALNTQNQKEQSAAQGQATKKSVMLGLIRGATNPAKPVYRPTYLNR